MNNIVRKLKILHLLIKIYRNALFSSVLLQLNIGIFKNKSYKTIVDIGANKGQFALVARRLFPNSKIFLLIHYQIAQKFLIHSSKRMLTLFFLIMLLDHLLENKLYTYQRKMILHLFRNYKTSK